MRKLFLSIICFISTLFIGMIFAHAEEDVKVMCQYKVDCGALNSNAFNGDYTTIKFIDSQTVLIGEETEEVKYDEDHALLEAPFCRSGGDGANLVAFVMSKVVGKIDNTCPTLGLIFADPDSKALTPDNISGYVSPRSNNYSVIPFLYNEEYESYKEDYPDAFILEVKSSKEPTKEELEEKGGFVCYYECEHPNINSVNQMDKYSIIYDGENVSLEGINTGQFLNGADMLKGGIEKFRTCPDNIYIGGIADVSGGNNKTLYFTDDSKVTSAKTCKSISKNTYLEGAHEIDVKPIQPSEDSEINVNPNLTGKIIDEETQKIIDWVLNLVRIVGIVLMVVLGILDFVKAVASGSEDQVKKSKDSFVKRLIACVILFLIPIIVSFLMWLINTTFVSTLPDGNKTNSVNSNSSNNNQNNSDNNNTQNTSARKCSSLDLNECKTRSDCKYEKGCKVKDEFSIDTNTNFAMRVRPPSNDPNDSSYKLYYTDEITRTPDYEIGECSWYASKRAYEITKSLGVTPFKIADGGINGSAFCEEGKSNFKDYKVCYPDKENCELKQGTLISYRSSHDVYGHVAIIEQVNGDKVRLSHGKVGLGVYGHAIGDTRNPYTYPALDNKTISRLDNCTGTYTGSAGTYSNTGCFENIEKTKSGAINIYDGYSPICYIYLTEPK